MNQQTIDIIKRSRQTILSNWITLEKDEVHFVDGGFTADELDGESSPLLSAVVGRLSNNENNKEGKDATAFLDDHLSAVTLRWTQRGLTPTDTVSYLLNLKNTLLSVLQDNIADPRELYAEMLQMDKFMDGIGINVFETYIRKREGEIMRQAGEINDIRTPIIQVWKGIIALPLIGTVDSSRTMEVMDDLLQYIAKNSIDTAIIDISGVPVIDSNVAQNLSLVVKAIRLLGSECIISGIRPEIAQTIVNLGIDMTSIVTKAKLADALRVAFNTNKLQVAKK